MDTEEARDLEPSPASLRDYLVAGKRALSMFRWTWNILPRVSKKRLGTVLAGLVVVTVAGLAVPRFVGTVVDGAAGKRGAQIALGLAGVALCLTVQKAADYACAVAREWVLGTTWGAVDRHITIRFFEKSVGQHVSDSHRLAVSNIDKGRWKLLDLQGMLFFEGIPALLSLLFAYAFLWCFLPVAGGIMTIGVAGSLGWTLYLNRKVLTVCAPLDAEFRRLNRYRIERWEKVERVKTSTRAKEEVAHTDNWFARLITKDRKFWIWFIRQNIRRGSIHSTCLLATLGYGAWLAATEQATVSLLLPLFFWATQVNENLWRIGHVEHQISWNAPSVRSMIEAVSIPPDVTSGTTPFDPARPLTVEFAGVGHRYPADANTRADAGLAVLSGISFLLSPGEKVALLGESGSGKTTVMRLLLRYMDPTEGAIRIQDTDLRDLDLESWWRVIGYIPQQAQVLDGTIRDNLVYALSPEERTRTRDEDLWDLMRLLRIDFGARLTNGLDTLVGRNGLKLSGGQAQRLMIGAAAVKKPRFMIIDEATSSLDSTTEKIVQRGLADVLRPEVGALVVAHRLSTVRDLCNRFVVLRSAEAVPDGEPQVEAEAGSFEDLYRISPTFRQLADDQGLRMSSGERVGMHLAS